MIKTIIRVRMQAGESADPNNRPHAIDDLSRAARNFAASDDTVRGLIISRVLRAFAPEDDLVVLVGVWTESDLGQSLVAGCVPAELRSKWNLAVAAVSTSETVLRKVVEFANHSSQWKVKLAGTAFRRDDFELDAFFDYWYTVHALIGGSVPGVGGYVVSRVAEVIEGDEDADAFIEQWYKDEGSFDDAQLTAEAQAAWNDVGNYAKTTGTFWLMGEEVVVRPPDSGPGLLEVKRG